MADSFITEQRRSVYFCHQCKRAISSVTESFTCPSCDSEFIEEVPINENLQSSVNEPESNDELFNAIFRGINNSSIHFLPEELFNLIISSNRQINISGPHIRFLHGNFYDYAWGSDGLDTIITQLLNQIDNTGPPPMPDEEINNLKDKLIEKNHVDINLQCPVCMEDFVLDENVKELLCHHFFHKNCIVPWLKKHATCPTCRESFHNSNSKNNNSSDTQIRNDNAGTSSGFRSTNDPLPKSNAEYEFPDDYD